MNKFICGFIVGVSILLAAGCSTILDNNQGVFGKAQANNKKTDTQIRIVENQQAQANEDKLAHIGAWSQGGVEHALNQITTNVPNEVVVAKEMNARIEALAGKPDFKEVELIQGIVDDLLSQVKEVRIAGEKALALKDKETVKIQEQDKKLIAQREDAVADALKQADANAQAADQYKSTLNQMDSWGGLGAIWYGVHKLVIRMAWFLGIGGLIFLILRILATSNPIASAIFNIFEQMGSWAINTISLILPKALSIAGNVSVEAYSSTKNALKAVVDSVETAKLQAAGTGKVATLQDLLDNAKSTMTDADKANIDKMKVELGWSKPAVVTTTVTSSVIPTITSTVTPVVAASPIIVTPPSTSVIVDTPPSTNG